MASYIPALVIQRKNTVFISDQGIAAEKSGSTELVTGLGLYTEIPTPDGGGAIDADYWAVPINEGGPTGFKFTPYNPADPVTSIAPDVQAFKVFRIVDFNRGGDDFYVVGTIAQYITAAGGGAALPLSISTLQVGCQTLCQFNTNGLYFGVLGLPTLIGNQRYFPAGYFNGVALPTASSSGYTTTGTLLTFLNTATTGWAAVGTWTVANGVLLVSQTAGPGDDVLCAGIFAINPSL